MGAYLLFCHVHLSRCVAVALTQLIIILSLTVPYSAYASTASVIQTSYLGRLSNGYHNFKYTLSNSATGLSKSVTKAVSPASLGKVLKFVVSKRLAVFMSLASLSSVCVSWLFHLSPLLLSAIFPVVMPLFLLSPLCHLLLPP